MEGLISDTGLLSIKRDKRGYRAQYCPFTTSDLAVCGDWCPLFGEPSKDMLYSPALSDYVPTGAVSIQICRTILAFDTLTDNRIR